MRVFARMLRVAAAETAAGAVVPAPFPVPDAHADGVAAMLGDLHRRTIDRADRVVVVTDATGSCGSATTAEVARARGVPVHTRQVHQDPRGTQGGEVW